MRQTEYSSSVSQRMVLIGVVCNFFSLVLSAMTFQYLPLIFIFQGFCIGVSGGIGMPMYLALPRRDSPGPALQKFADRSCSTVNGLVGRGALPLESLRPEVDLGEV